MDEYEIDLRDYLIVIWERKWIIVGVFVAAIIAAAVYSYTLPDEYRAQALLSYQSSPVSNVAREGTGSLALGLPNAKGLISVIDSMGNAQAETLNGSDLIRLRVSGTSSPSDLEDGLQATIASVREFLANQMGTQVTERLSTLGDEIQFLRDQRSSLLERIRQRETQRLQALQAQRDQVVQQLDQLMDGSSADGTSSPGQATLLAMTAQLQVLQGQMARLETSSDAPQPEAGSAYEQRLVELETQIQELALAKRQYERVRDADWSPLSVAQPPQSSGAPIGPNRGLNVAIAGVLGLFVGLLLAFFVHYLQSEPLTRRESGQQPPDSAS